MLALAMKTEAEHSAVSCCLHLGQVWVSMSVTVLIKVTMALMKLHNQNQGGEGGLFSLCFL